MSDDPAKAPEEPGDPQGGESQGGEPQGAAPPSSAPADAGAAPAHAGGDVDGTAAEPGEAYQAAAKVSPWGYMFIAGLAAFLTGWAWYRVEDDTGITTQVWIFLAALLTLAPIAWHAVDFFQSVASRRGGAFLNVVVTVSLAFVVMGIVSALNITKGENLQSEKLHGFLGAAADMTESRRYTLGDETNKILAKIDGTVYATYLARPGQGSRTSPDLRAMAIEQLKVYGFHSNRIVVRVFDDIKENTAAAEYLRKHGVSSTSAGETDDLIVLSYAAQGREVAQGKQKEVKVEAFTFAKAGSADGQPRWLGERVITSAIQELVFVQLKAYAVGGHGERGLADQMRLIRERLRAQNIEVVDEPLLLALAPKIPDDCDLLLILGPRESFEAGEVAKIRTWLDRGHALFVSVDVVDPKDIRRETGLEQNLLTDFGLRPRIDHVVLAPELQEVRGGTMVQMSPELRVAGKDYGGHASVEALRRGSGFATRFFDSSFVDVEATPDEGLTVDPVAWAPDPGLKDVPRPYALKVSKGRDYKAVGPDDITNVRLALIAVATRDLPPGPDGGKRDARVVLSGDTDVFSDRGIQQNAPNADLFGGLVQWALRRADLASVSDKTLDLDLVDIGDREHRMAFWWPLVTALSALLAGAAVWWARRR